MFYLGSDRQPSMNDDNQNIPEGLDDTLAELAKLTPAQRTKFLEMVHNPRTPLSWKSSTVASYFNQQYGEWVKLTLDQMLADTRPAGRKLSMKFLCKDFGGISQATLRARIQQGWQWLIANVDTPSDNTYAKLRKAIEIGNGEKNVIRLDWKQGIAGIIPDGIRTARPEDKYKWREEFNDWLDLGCDLDVFHRTELDLGPEDLDWIRTQMGMLPSYHILKLTDNEMKIAKDEELGKLK